MCAKLIVENEADVNNCSRQGLPALVAACETANENEQLCLMMLERGADPNSKDQVSATTDLGCFIILLKQ